MSDIDLNEDAPYQATILTENKEHLQCYFRVKIIKCQIKTYKLSTLPPYKWGY